MSDEIDLAGLADVPDPFAGPATAPARRADPARMPPSPGRARVRAQRFLAVGVALACEAAGVVLLGHRPDLGSMPVTRLAFAVAVPLAAGVLALTAVTRRGVTGLGETKPRIVGFAMAAVLFFAAVTWVGAPPLPADGGFWRHAGGCFVLTACLAVGPLLLSMLAFRRAFAMESFWRAAALGVASGGLATATMALVCPVDGASHVLVGHGAVMLVAGALGAAVGRSVCRA